MIAAEIPTPKVKSVINDPNRLNIAISTLFREKYDIRVPNSYA